MHQQLSFFPYLSHTKPKKIHTTFTEGKLIDGTVFDSSYSRGKPFEFIIGAGNVIEGWDVGLMQCSQGEKATLTVSPELAYGAAGHGPVPPNAALVFEVWLQKIESGDRAQGVRPKRAEFAEAAKMLMGDVQHRM